VSSLTSVILQCLPEAKGAMLGKLGHFVEKSGKGKQ